MRFIQPYDGRTITPVITPQPVGYRIRKNPRDKRLWTFCERKANAMATVNRLRASGYHKATMEALYLD